MKLVRNLIPRLFPGNEYYVVEGRELAMALRLKLIEEAGEVVGARNATEIMHELGDVLTVAQTLADHYGIPWSAVEYHSKAKGVRLGGFGEGWVMTDFDEEG